MCGPSYLLVACCGSVNMLLTSEVSDDQSFFGAPNQLPPLLDIAIASNTEVASKAWPGRRLRSMLHKTSGRQ